MYALNRVSLLGHATEKPEVKTTQTGRSVTSLNLKTTSTIQKADGSNLTLSHYHRVTIWGRMAEITEDYVSPGSQVYIQGRLRTNSWETPEGQKRSRTEVQAEDIIILDPRPGAEVSVPAGSQAGQGMNLTELVGNLVRGPEIRQTSNGSKVANCSVATNRRWRGQDGQENEETEFTNLVFWGPLADDIEQWGKKGQKVYIQGRLEGRSFETQAGEKRNITEVNVTQLRILGVRDETMGQGSHAQRQGDSQGSHHSSVAGAAVGAGAGALAGGAAGAAVGASVASAQEPELPTIQYESDVNPDDLPF